MIQTSRPYSAPISPARYIRAFRQAVGGRHFMADRNWVSTASAGVLLAVSASAVARVPFCPRYEKFGVTYALSGPGLPVPAIPLPVALPKGHVAVVVRYTPSESRESWRVSAEQNPWPSRTLRPSSRTPRGIASGASAAAAPAPPAAPSSPAARRPRAWCRAIV